MADVIQQSPMIVWTALAHGRSPGSYSVSAFVSFRLGRGVSTPASLRDYVTLGAPLSLLDWPAVIADIDRRRGFSITIGDQTRRARLATRVPLDSVAYKKIFSELTRVDPFTHRPKESFNIPEPYNVSKIVGVIKAAHTPPLIEAPITNGAQPVAPRLASGLSQNI